MITQRQAQILAAIVRENSNTGHPVGSEDLAAKYKFGVSSATIRNDMQVLEDEGLIAQPHTSAGRIPTDEGFRYFVNKLMKHLELSTSEQRRLEQELHRLQKQYLEFGRSLTKLLAETSRGAAFALLPEGAVATGLSQVIDEAARPEEIRGLADFLEEVEKYGQPFLDHELYDVETFIGREARLPAIRDFSLVVTRVRLPSGGKGVIGIIGPKRMKYARNISLLEYISKLLAGGLGLIIIFNF